MTANILLEWTDACIAAVAVDRSHIFRQDLLPAVWGLVPYLGFRSDLGICPKGLRSTAQHCCPPKMYEFLVGSVDTRFFCVFAHVDWKIVLK